MVNLTYKPSLLTVAVLNVVALNVAMLNVIMLNVTMLNVAMQNVVAPTSILEDLRGTWVQWYKSFYGRNL
jgi:hypothetical protein